MNLAVGLVMLVVTQNQNTTATTTPVVSEEIQTSVTTKSTSKIGNPTEAVVREYYKEHPLLIDIAHCESRFIQFDADGSVHRGKINNKDVGVMQINEFYHLEKSKSMGMDIYTLEGNLEYGLYLFETQGSQPWSASSPCWAKAEVAKF